MKDIASLPISVLVVFCTIIALIMAGISSCCKYCEEHHDEWEKENF